VLDEDATAERFESSVAAVRTRRDVVEVAGADAATYLDGQLSQSVLGLAVGSSAPTLLLQPQGKVDAWARLSRLADERFWLDIDPGYGELALARLQRFLLRTRAELTLLSLELVAVRGPAAAGGPASLGVAAPAGGAVLDALWPGVDGFDLLGPQVDVPHGIDEGAPEALEALRIRLGVPAMGSELDGSTIPAAAGIVDRSVDFTKGCYVGQELVARIDSRGSNTPTKLRGLRAPAGAAMAAGAELVQGDQPIGRVTSVATPPGSAVVGLGYVKRGVEPPATAELATASGERVVVEIVALPLS
jgi:folate-binding protein YgfZ